MNATDHDHFGTRQPQIDRMGVQDRVAGFPGCEVSPLLGHTTAAGCRNPPSYPTYYSVDFVLYDDSASMTRLATASEIFHQARTQFQCDFLAVNHPYRDEGMFVQFKIDGTSYPALAEPDFDLHRVDGIEMYNKSDSVESILANNLPAWFNLLNRGYTLVAVGGSDEHGYAGSYGSPRNLVRVSKKPGDAGLHAAVFEALKAGRSLVFGGPHVELTVNGAGMGETVATASGTVQVRLVVKAPAWMQLSFARVYANGAIVLEAVPKDTTDVIRVDETFDLPLLADSHLEAAAGSTLPEHDLTPVSPRPPFSVTNPVFVDADGSGYVPIHRDGAPWD